MRVYITISMILPLLLWQPPLVMFQSIEPSVDVLLSSSENFDHLHRPQHGPPLLFHRLAVVPIASQFWKLYLSFLQMLQ